MLRRLRGPRAADPSSSAPAGADGQANGGIAGGARAAAAAAALTPLTLHEKVAMLTDTLVEIVPGVLLPFSRQELVRIKKRFVNLQQDDLPTHSSIRAACASIPALSGSPFAKLLMQLIAALTTESVEGASGLPKGSPRRVGQQSAPDRIGFDGFLTVLSVLSVKQSVAVKRQVLFRIYDADRDGVVSIDDFVATLMATTSALSRAELKAAIAAHFSSWTSPSRETHLSAETFQALFSDADVHAALTVAF